MTDERIKYAIKIAKRLNQRYRTLERKNLKYFSISYEKYKTSLSSDFIGNTGYLTQSKRRLETFTEEQFNKYVEFIENELQHKSSTVRQARKVQERSYENLKEKITDIEDYWGITLTQDERDMLISGGLLNIDEYDSYQVIEDWLESKKGGVTIKQFIDTINKSKEKFKDEDEYSRMKKRLKRIVIKNNKKKK